MSWKAAQSARHVLHFLFQLLQRFEHFFRVYRAPRLLIEFFKTTGRIVNLGDLCPHLRQTSAVILDAVELVGAADCLQSEDGFGLADHGVVIVDFVDAASNSSDGGKHLLVPSIHGLLGA